MKTEDITGSLSTLRGRYRKERENESIVDFGNHIKYRNGDIEVQCGGIVGKLRFYVGESGKKYAGAC